MNRTAGTLFIVLILGCIVGRIFLAMDMTPDSFAYLNGGKNLLLHRTYTYDCNNVPITLFAPLYSIFLGFFMGMFGLNGLAAAILNSLLFLVAFSIVFWGFSLNKKAGFPVLVAMITAYVLYHYMGGVLSESLFIPLFLVWFWLLNQYRGPESRKILFVLILEILCLSTRFSGILLIASWYLTVLVFDLGKVRAQKKITVADLAKYIVPLISLGYVTWLRNYIGLGGEQHHFRFGSGKYPFYTYIRQSLGDISYLSLGDALAYQLELRGWIFLSSFAIVALLLVFFKVSLPKKILYFLVIAFVIHIFILSNVWIEDGAGGRYMFWLYLGVLTNVDIKARDSIFRSEKRRRMANSALIYVVCFFVFINFAYFSKKDLAIFRMTESPSKLTVRDHFMDGVRTMTRPEEPSYFYKDGQRFIVSPCYPWNLQGHP